MKKLTEVEIKDRLNNLSDWDYYDDALHTDFEFDNFKELLQKLFSKKKKEKDVEEKKEDQNEDENLTSDFITVKKKQN